MNALMEVLHNVRTFGHEADPLMTSRGLSPLWRNNFEKIKEKTT